MLQFMSLFKYRVKYNYGRILPLRVPVDVSLELSSACNMGCSYCYHSDKKKLPFKQGFMSREIAFSIIEQAALLGVHSLKFNWKGEGTLNPNYRLITEHARSLARGSTFIDRIANSNFKIIPQKREDVFHGLASLTKVKVSYDSFRKFVFEKQRTGGDHDLTTENVDLFYNHPARIKSETQLVIQAVRTRLNADEDIAGEIKKRWPEAKASIRDMVAGRVESEKVGQMEARRRDVDNRQSCIQAHVRLIFNHEGRAFPCCPDIKEQLELGDIRTEKLYDIFNGEFARSLRADLKNGQAFEENPCRTCSSFESYKGYKQPWGS